MKKENDELLSTQKVSEIETMKLQNKYKELMMKYNKLETKYNEKVKQSDHTLWTTTDIAKWIVGLDQSRYNKYYDILLQNMKNEGIDGFCLGYLDKTDLHKFGITQFKDKRDVYNNIQKLVQNKNVKNNKAMNDGQNEGVDDNTVYV